MRRASTVLQDAGSTRWTYPEMLDWLNDSLLEISNVAPELLSEIRVISLISGTLQTLPADTTRMLRAICNVSGAQAPYTRGAAITPISHAILTAQLPDWQSTATLPYSAVVNHIIYDPVTPRDFYVVPGNNGSGKIEAAFSVRATPIALPGSPLSLASYTANIPVDDIYANAILDYVLYRALQKELAVPGAAEKAMMHYQAFAGAIGASAQAMPRTTPSTADPAKRQ